MKNLSFLTIFTIILCFCVISCKKNDPNPELTDSIYLDLKSELELSTKQEVDLQRQLEKDILKYKTTKPQTGMYAANRNKVSTSESLLNIIQQQKRFFAIKLEQRKIYVNERYLESLRKNGRPWPDEKELADYKIRMKLQREKFEADVRNVPRGTSDKKDSKNKPSKEKSKNEVAKPEH